MKYIFAICIGIVLGTAIVQYQIEKNYKSDDVTYIAHPVGIPTNDVFANAGMGGSADGEESDVNAGSGFAVTLSFKECSDLGGEVLSNGVCMPLGDLDSFIKRVEKLR